VRKVKVAASPTIYPNQYYTDFGGGAGNQFKHIFIGSERILTKKARVAPDRQHWYYHPDHLGSTSMVTNENSQLVDALHYFPFGEVWLEERPASLPADYFFTAKEFDSETGFYDFGARYLDPRFSKWMSADPTLGDYLSNRAGRMGGIYLPQNTGVYSYSWNNPATLKDPSGADVLDFTTKELNAIMFTNYIYRDMVKYNNFERYYALRGLLFENAVLESIGAKFNRRIFDSPARYVRTLARPDGPIAGVRPDALFGVDTKITNGNTVEVYTREGFLDVKATSGSIRPSYDDHQILGMIDAADRERLKQGTDRAMTGVLLITTADADVHPDTVQYATNRNVLLYHSKVQYDDQTMEIMAGPAKLLNPSLLPKNRAIEIPGDFSLTGSRVLIRP
jgi:RHS repeat-associated protein